MSAGAKYFEGVGEPSTSRMAGQSQKEDKEPRRINIRVDPDEFHQLKVKATEQNKTWQMLLPLIREWLSPESQQQPKLPITREMDVPPAFEPVVMQLVKLLSIPEDQIGPSARGLRDWIVHVLENELWEHMDKKTQPGS